MSALVFTSVPAYREASIADGYVYECSCGELYNCVNAALSCRKCRNYCVFGYCTHVIDIRSNTVVAGEVPDVEEYEEAKLRAEAKWAEEKAQLDFNTQMWIKEGELYEAEMARLAEESAVLAEREKMDTLWAIQDTMMGF